MCHNNSINEIELVEMVVDDCIRVYDHLSSLCSIERRTSVSYLRRGFLRWSH